MTTSHQTFTLSLLAAALTLIVSIDGLAGDRDWHFTYNSRGQVLTADGPRLPSDVIDLTTYTYDTAGNRTSTTNALGHVVLMQNYNSRGQPGLVTDANGVHTLLLYHVRGWLLSTTVKDPGGNAAWDATTSYDYDNEGQLLSTTLPDGTILYNEYDAAHRLKAISNNLGERIDYTMDDAGNRTVEVTSAAGGSITRGLTLAYDELSRLIEITGAAGQITTFGYDQNGNQNTTTDGNLNTTTQTHDALDRLSGTFAPLGHHVLYQNDDQDNLTQVTDPRALHTLYEFDGLDNLEQLTSPDTGVTTYTYDEAGNRLSQTDARGIVTTYTYDALNRVLTTTYPTQQSKNVTYTYDNGGFCVYCQGRLREMSDSSGTTQYFYDYFGRVIIRNSVVQLPGGGTVALATRFSYNRAGRVTKIEYPNGQIINYGLDGIGQVNQVTRKESAASSTVSVASNISYQPFGPIKAITYGNALQMSRDYDLDGRLETQAISHGKQNVAYGYDAANNIENIDNAIDPGRDENYTYDALDRLQTATGTYGAFSYGYDFNGNRTVRAYNRAGQPATTETYSYSPTSNQLDSIAIDKGGILSQRSFLYDLNGNLIDETRADGGHRKPHYDDTNRMDSVTP